MMRTMNSLRYRFVDVVVAVVAVAVVVVVRGAQFGSGRESHDEGEENGDDVLYYWHPLYWWYSIVLR